LINAKKIHVNGPGQKESLQSHQLISRVTANLNCHVDRYQCTHEAALQLNLSGEWTKQYRILNNDNVCPPTHEEDSLGVGFRKLSWLWTAQQFDKSNIPTSKDRDSISEEEIHKCVYSVSYESKIFSNKLLAMQLEWAEGRVQVDCWNEEIHLQIEEMTRSIKTLSFIAQTWVSCKHTRPNVPRLVQQGLDAYAEQQSVIYNGLTHSFYGLWKPIVEQLGLTASWPALSMGADILGHTNIVDVGALIKITPFCTNILTDDATNGDGLGEFTYGTNNLDNEKEDGSTLVYNDGSDDDD
jgi:hypothetical protein